MNYSGCQAQLPAGPTQALAAFVVDTNYEDLPSSVIRAAKDLILDSWGCTIGGATLTPGRIVIELFEELGGVPEATVWATGKRLPCLHATYINAYLANLLDFDDTYSGGAGHPGATVVPPALALAEKVHASGRELLNAVVLGYEVSIRIGVAIKPSPQRYGVAWGYGFQIFGAAAAAARLLNLDREQTAMSFGLAGIAAPVPGTVLADYHGPERPVFTWAKNNYGWIAMGGVLAALLSARGFVGHRSILDGEKGFWVMAGSDRCDERHMTAALGRDFLMVETEHKPYPTCRWTHSSLDALNQILAEHTIDPADISEIRVKTFSRLMSLSSPAPEDTVAVQFSLPYLLALRLHGRPLTPWLSSEDLGNPDILDLARKVVLELDPEAERAYFETSRRPSTVIIKTVTGEVYSQTVESGRGGPDQRLTSDELRVKFRSL